MNQNQFNNKYRNLNISDRELKRMYDVYLREQEELAYLYEMSMALRNSQSTQSTAGGGGSSSDNPTPPPVTSLGSASLLTYVDADDHFRIVVVNYEDGTMSTPFDTGVLYDSGSSYVSANYTISHDKGFMIVLYNSPLARTECFFITNGGVLVDTIVTFGGSSDGTLEYKGAYFADYEPDNEPTTEIILKIFDGVNVVTHTLNDTSSVTEIGGWNNRDLFSDVGVIGTINRTNNDVETYLFRWDGTRSLIFTHEVGINYTIICSSDSEFLVVFDQDTNDSYNYTRARKWSGNDLILEETPLNSGDLVNSYIQIFSYGTNQTIAVLYNYDFPENEWLIYYTNLGTTRVDRHPRGTAEYEYGEVFITPRKIWQPSNVINETAIVIFRSLGTGSSIVPAFNDYTHFVVYCYSEDATLNTLNIANPTTMAVLYDSNDGGRGGVYSKNPVISFFNPSDYLNLELTFFTPGGPTTIDTSVSLDNLNNLETYAISPDYTLLRYALTSEADKQYWMIYDSTGNDAISVRETTNTLNYDSPPVNLGCVLVIDEGSINNSFAWGAEIGLIELNNDLLTQGNTYNILGQSNVRNDFGTLNGSSPGYQVLLETESGKSTAFRFFILNESGWSGPFPTGLGNSEIESHVRLGETVFYYGWYGIDDVYVFDTYSLANGERICNYDTGFTVLDDFGDYGDRNYIRFAVDTDYTYAYLTKTGDVKTITIPQTSTNTSWNDAYWSWDD